MDHDWQNELAELTHMGVSELRGKYAELFGEHFLGPAAQSSRFGPTRCPKHRMQSGSRC